MTARPSPLIAAAVVAAILIVAIAVFLILSGMTEQEAMTERPAEGATPEATRAGQAEETKERPAEEQEAMKAEVGPGEGMIAPDFTLQALDGSTVTLSEYRGRVVVLWFMIPVGCPICQVQVEDLKRIYEEYMDRVVVIAVTPLDYEGVEEDMMKFAEERGRPEWIYAVDTAGLTLKYDIIEMGVIVIGPDGRILLRGIPTADYDELKMAIEEALSA